MGDTFQDEWQNQIPDEWKGWTFGGCDNTKWDGNFYTFIHPQDERQEGGTKGRRMEVFIHSGNSEKMELSGGCHFFDEDTGLSVDAKRDWDWEKVPRGEFYWSSIDQALTALTANFEATLACLIPAMTHLRAAHLRWKG